jgi:hypothetical protein
LPSPDYHIGSGIGSQGRGRDLILVIDVEQIKWIWDDEKAVARITTSFEGRAYEDGDI